jgi:hypothetical protein
MNYRSLHEDMPGLCSEVEANQPKLGTCWDLCPYHTRNLEIEDWELGCLGLVSCNGPSWGALLTAVLHCIPLYHYHLDIPNFGNSSFRGLLYDVTFQH